jgi:hypothetical protein
VFNRFFPAFIGETLPHFGTTSPEEADLLSGWKDIAKAEV